MSPRAPFRFCPACGQPLMATPGRQHCTACGYTHYPDPKVAVATLVTQGGRVLLIQRGVQPARGLWALPAGFMDAGEDPARAAERETLEETGLVVRATTVTQVFGRLDPNGAADVLIVYQAEVLGGAVRAGDDALAARFFTPQAVRALPLAFESTRQVLGLTTGL